MLQEDSFLAIRKVRGERAYRKSLFVPLSYEEIKNAKEVVQDEGKLEAFVCHSEDVSVIIV